jgi:cyclomaltodextrinase / maltogenic alpha-amylase / neopullulanase
MAEHGVERAPQGGLRSGRRPVPHEAAVVYGVIPRLFGDAPFAAVRERIAYLAALGVTHLWLSPVNVSPEGDFGYAVRDYFELNPKLGTKDEFRALVDEAHAHGIGVLMDFVPNHTSDEHPYYRDTVEHGEASPYWTWYDRDANGERTYYFDWTNLPNLNFDNPDVERHVTEAFAYWVRELGVDGFRVDVAWGVKLRRPDYWPRWREALLAIDPDLLLIAEASARDPYYGTHGYDAAYDWTDELGHWAWEDVFGQKSPGGITRALHEALTNGGKGYPPDALVFRFLNNNDTGPRFVTAHGPAMTRVATALLLTLPGIPCIYTGDEVGAEFEPYKGPPPISWEGDPELYEWHRRLIELRRSVPALHSREWEPLGDGGSPTYSYVRYGPGGSLAVVTLNFGDAPATATLRLPARAAAARGPLADLLGGDPVTLAGDVLEVPVGPFGARILTTDEI